MVFSSGAGIHGLSAELLRVGGWSPGGGKREEGGMIISGILRESGGRRVSWVVVLNLPPDDKLLLADLLPGKRALELHIESCVARAPTRRHLPSGISCGCQGRGELDRRPLPHPHQAISAELTSSTTNTKGKDDDTSFLGTGTRRICTSASMLCVKDLK